ncbi:MAG TPA: hypothetical protein VJ486_03595 [Geothrix sp.]|nr:hypothetical protein [Geothrix sp.]
MSIQALIVELLALLAAGYFLREGILSFRSEDSCPSGSCAKCPFSEEHGAARKACAAVPVRANRRRTPGGN